MIDSKSLGVVDGFDIVAELWPDYEPSPDEYEDDMFSDKQREAFNRGEWSYVGIVVRANLRGFALGSASLWGIEADDLDEALITVGYLVMTILTRVASMIVEAVADANREYAALVGARYSRTEV